MKYFSLILGGVIFFIGFTSSSNAAPSVFNTIKGVDFKSYECAQPLYSSTQYAKIERIADGSYILKTNVSDFGTTQEHIYRNYSCKAVGGNSPLIGCVYKDKDNKVHDGAEAEIRCGAHIDEVFGVSTGLKRNWTETSPSCHKSFSYDELSASMTNVFIFLSEPSKNPEFSEDHILFGDFGHKHFECKLSL